MIFDFFDRTFHPVDRSDDFIVFDRNENDNAVSRHERIHSVDDGMLF